jgi:DamX protein
LVLFAEPSIDRRGALKAAAARIYRCPLERLDQAQARSYLRRTQPMLSEDLNQTQLDNILVDSGGVKGEIDRRVEDILHEPRPARGLPLIHVSMLLALIVIVGTALWFEAGSESSVTSQPLALDVSTADTATSAERASLSVAPQPLPAPKLSTDAADLPTLDSDANTVTKTPQVPAMRALPGQSRNLSMAVILPTGASAETAAETRLQAVARTPAKTTITTRDIPEQTASQAPLIAAPEPSLRALNAGTADWIYSAGPGEYTLQLMGSYSLEGIEAFIATTPDPERFAYFVTRRGSDIWYVLTAGRYPSREAAIAAINVLPLNLRDAKPWARSVESIRASVGF